MLFGSLVTNLFVLVTSQDFVDASGYSISDGYLCLVGTTQFKFKFIVFGAVESTALLFGPIGGLD